MSEVSPIGMSKWPAFVLAGVGIVVGIAALVGVFQPGWGSAWGWVVLALVAGFDIGWALSMYRLTVWTNRMSASVKELEAVFQRVEVIGDRG